jgi:hypothetical protein
MDQWQPKLSVYLSGPMRGYPEYNFPAFHLAKGVLEGLGCVVTSPASLDLEEGFDPTGGLPEGFLRQAAIRDFQAILQCEAIVMLPGWKKSTGALAEWHIAKWLEMPIYYHYPDHEGLVTNPEPLLDPTLATPVLEEKCAPEPTLKVFQGEAMGEHPPKEEDILEEALRLTKGDRQNSYGPPQQDFTRTATIWGAILGTPVSAKQVALCMIGLKISRATWSSKRDNWVDAAGYARCGWLCDESENT